MNRLGRVAATLVVAAAGVVVGPGAQAAACTSADGVTVVVDFHELGGGLSQACDTDGGGKKASTLFPDNGFPLTYVQRQPGFVCRVSGKPASDPCVNTPPPDKYWGLWWSNGENGAWSYSSAGAASLTIPEGGAVAFSWNNSNTKSPPGAPPPKHADSPSPTATPQPTKPPKPPRSSNPSPTAGPSTPGTGSASGSASASDAQSDSPSASASERAERRKQEKAERQRRERTDRPRDRATESETASGAPAPADSTPAAAAGDAPDPDDGGLPVWVAPAAIGVLFAVAGGAAYLRRRAA